MSRTAPLRTKHLLALTAVAALVVTACGGDDDAADSPSAPAPTEAAGGATDATEPPAAEVNPVINLVGFAVPEAANVAIAKAWGETPAGQGIRFESSYGASGDQSRSVVDGLPADYVHFSVASDVTRLVDNGLVAEDWNAGPNGGVVSSSIVVFGVRPGNPLGIESWDDLIADGIEIVSPNPASSGAARWNALAAWGQVVEHGGTEDEANEFLTALFANVVALPNSGRDATQAFLSGTGNVFLTYENEAILARQNGEPLEYVIPDTTLLIENPGAVLIDANPKATEWLDFVLSPAGQAEFAKKGFRPIVDGADYGEVDGANDPTDPFPAIAHLQTVADDFVSWSDLSKKFFDEETGIVTQIILASGKAEG
ncbi:MAG TPA: sulfate ABC transporter substrate-binding protein [Ilumatobacter sp.]|nr:sulfate ABC transporter substrate-binding protein [Ilumatobacter sp.]